MWPICYEDINKLHMSIGMGLLVAAFIILISFNNSTCDSIKFQSEIAIEDVRFIIESNFSDSDVILESLQIIRALPTDCENRKLQQMARAQKFLTLVGCFFFIIGYLPYLFINYHKFTKK